MPRSEIRLCRRLVGVRNSPLFIFLRFFFFFLTPQNFLPCCSMDATWSISLVNSVSIVMVSLIMPA
ncbi:hypothetical protein BC940DRAFT_288280 [Gongronella butleri]|nr:hypothetical protein BC940DRAFT_288280 [Gongronella butleri]